MKRKGLGNIFGDLFGRSDRVATNNVINRLQNQLQALQTQVITNSYGIAAKYIYNSLQERVEAYTTNAALYSIVNKITKSAAIAPFKVYKIKDKKKHLKYKSWTGDTATPESIHRALMLKELTYEEDTTHWLNKLIDRPNKWTRGTEFTTNAIAFKLLSGNRFLRLNILDAGMDKGRVQEIDILPPQFMRIVSDGTIGGVDGYVFDMGGNAQRLEQNEVVHSKYFNPEHDNVGTQLWGLSPLSAAYKNLDRAEAGIDRSVLMLQNGGAPGVIYNEDADGWTVEQAQQMKDKVNHELLGIGNTNKIGVANGKLGWLPFGLSAVDMEILELEKYSWQQLCNIYGVPPGLFDPDKTGEHNAKEFKKELITSAVLPELSSLRDDWNEIARRGGDDRYIDYDISFYPEMQEDMTEVAKRLDLMPFMTFNEKRVAVGLDEDNDEAMMSKYLVPSGLTPLDQLADNTQGLIDQMNGQA